MTLPRKGLKKYDYNIDMTTLPKKGLKTRPYNIGMEKRYLKKYDYNIDMEKKDLKKLTKGQLIKLLLKQEKKKPKVVIVDDTKPVPTPRTYKSRPPVPTPRKSVNDMVQFFENKPTPPPRTGKWENVKPKPVPRKSVNKVLINIKNKDEECFRWCHIRQLNPQTEHPERIKKEDKKMVNKLNYDGIDFPLSQKHYNKVEKQNNIRINVFGYEKGQPFPIHISKETFEDQMNLLLITEDEKKHYVLIKDFNAFMYNQSKHKERKHFCMYCLQCFSSERILANHVNNCLTINGAQAINMPKQGENVLKFNNFHKQLPVPFVIYADFEAITKKVQGCKQVKRWRMRRIRDHTQKPTRLMKTVVMDKS